MAEQTSHTGTSSTTITQDETEETESKQIFPRLLYRKFHLINVGLSLDILAYLDEEPTSETSPQRLVLKLKKPENEKKVQWNEETVDNELMGKKKSKCCCIYRKPHIFGESSSESDSDDDGCGHNAYCTGHKHKKKYSHDHDHKSSTHDSDGEHAAKE